MQGENADWMDNKSQHNLSNKYGRRKRERVGEHSDDVKNDLLIIHYLPALLMR